MNSLADRDTKSRKIVLKKSTRNGARNSASTVEKRELSLVADQRGKRSETGGSVNASATRQINSVGQIPSPEAILSGSATVGKDDKKYVLNEQVSTHAIVYRVSNGTTWLVHSDALDDDQMIALAETKSEIRKHSKLHAFAVVPAAIFDEFYQQAQSFQKKKEALTESAQHKFFEDLVLRAVELGVSDIHITVGRGKVTVEFRIDGLLQTIEDFPWSISVEQTTSLVRSVFNTIAGGTTDSFNPRVPQDASIVHPIQGTNYQLRYAHDNIEGNGFHTVLRVLDDLSGGSDPEEGTFVPLQKLGLYDDEAAVIDLMMEAPFGFLCVSGTTGSGKSTFLKNLIGGYADANPGKNIVTVENPVEYLIFGAKQTSCPSADRMHIHLVSALRRDPDAVLIGEIRDEPSAQVAVRATMTGHFVWATLHASNALAQVARLEDIGVSRFKVTAPEFLAGMVHLELARKVCTSCRIHIKEALQRDLIPKERFDRVRIATNGQLESVYVANPKGCSECSETAPNGTRNVNAGFKGRMSVPELVVPTLKILNAIKVGDDLAAYEAWRQAGGKTMQENAVRRLIDGHLCANQIEAQFKRLNHDSEFYG